MTAKKDATAATATASLPEESTLGISHFELPKSIVTRVAKASLATDVSLQKDVQLALVKGSSVFINYVASAAQEAAVAKSQKTITAPHILEAIKALGWEDGPKMITLLKSELSAYRKIALAKKAAGTSTTRLAPIRRDGTGNITAAGAVPKKRGRKSAVELAALAAEEAAAASAAAASNAGSDDAAGSEGEDVDADENEDDDDDDAGGDDDDGARKGKGKAKRKERKEIPQKEEYYEEGEEEDDGFDEDEDDEADDDMDEDVTEKEGAATGMEEAEMDEGSDDD